MRLLEPVIWAKGTVLKPQHLQIQDRYFEESLNFKLRALNFRPWGFSTLRIDREALGSGLFSVSEASGMFPDGLLFGDAETLEWVIRIGKDPVTLPNGKPLTVRFDLSMPGVPPVFQKGYFALLACVADVAK